MSQAQQRTHVGALGALTLIGLSAVLSVATAQAEAAGGVCSVIDGAGPSAGYQRVGVHEISRVNARPWHIVPEGVAILLAAPVGVTLTDLHRAVEACAKSANGVAALSDSIRVSAEGGHYVVRLTARDRSRALALGRVARNNAPARREITRQLAAK